MKTIYEQVQEKALPLIKAYQDDLIKHDKNALENYPEMPFLHFTGDTGTCLVFLPPASGYPKAGEKIPCLFGTAERFHILRDKERIVECMKTTNRQDLILYFDGEKLIETTQEKAEAIAWKYQERILLEWEKLDRRQYETKRSSTNS